MELWKNLDWKELLEIIQANFLLCDGQLSKLEQVAQNRIQLSLENLQG